MRIRSQKDRYMKLGFETFVAGRPSSIHRAMWHLALMLALGTIAGTPPHARAESPELVSVHDGPAARVSMILRVPRGINLSDWTVTRLEDGSPVVGRADIKRIRDSEWKVITALLIDVSGSLKRGNAKQAEDALGEVKAALQGLLVADSLLDPEHHRVGLLSFGNNVILNRSFSRPGPDWEDEISELGKALGQRTVLYQALDKTLDQLDELGRSDTSAPKLSRILLVSDCRDDSGLASPEAGEDRMEAIRSRARALDVSIDVLARVRKDLERQDLANGYLRACERLAVGTGGSFGYAAPGGVTESLRELMTRIDSYSVVSFDRATDSALPKTQRTGLALSYPGEPDIVLELPHAMARTAPPPSRFPWAVLGVLAILTAVAVILAVRRRIGLLESASGRTPRSVAPPEAPIHLASDQRVGPLSKPEPGRPTVLLVATNGKHAGRCFPVQSAICSIGADAANDLCLADSERVSGRHALLRFQAGRLLLKDDGSLNGTYVNDEPIAGADCEVRPGDALRFADQGFEVRWPT